MAPEIVSAMAVVLSREASIWLCDASLIRS